MPCPFQTKMSIFEINIVSAAERRFWRLVYMFTFYCHAMFASFFIVYFVYDSYNNNDDKVASFRLSIPDLHSSEKLLGSPSPRVWSTANIAYGQWPAGLSVNWKTKSRLSYDIGYRIWSQQAH